MWKERSTVAFDQFGEVVLCPHCGGNNLHQTNTTIYERGEDADKTRVMAQSGNEMVVTDFPSQDVLNPSRRRHGLIIEFWCESCHSGSDDAETLTNPHRLAIFQHKGCTFMMWVE
jgi:hypothetical protein